jgi:large subunit ribosomal protein L21
MMNAVIETGGKQYRVKAGQLIRIEKLAGEAGDKITFDKVLLVSDDKDQHFGAPYLSSHTVTGEIIEQTKGEKIRVFTFKSKKRQRRTLGHRQPVTVVKILDIAGTKKAAEPKTETKKAEPKAKAKA